MEITIKQYIIVMLKIVSPSSRLMHIDGENKQRGKTGAYHHKIIMLFKKLFHLSPFFLELKEVNDGFGRLFILQKKRKRAY